MEIELKDVSRSYGELHAVNSISLSIPDNTVYGIIGRSGAGKSTLVRLMSLLEKLDAGVVLYDGQRVDNLDQKTLIQRRRKLGMIFQNFNLFSSRNAGQNVAYPMEICGYPKEKIQPRVKELMALVGLEGREDAPISTLSGGQKQRVAIARALSCEPDVLFCDEATSALDPQTTRSILTLIKDIQKKMNLTVVMITHQMEVVRDSCDYVAVLDAGKVVETGKVADIFSNPQSDVTKDFLYHLSSGGKKEQKRRESRMMRWSEEEGSYILRFRGMKTDSPLLSQLTKQLDVEFNIRAGGVQVVGDEEIGTLMCDIKGNQVEEALKELEKNGVIVEVVK